MKIHTPCESDPKYSIFHMYQPGGWLKNKIPYIHTQNSYGCQWEGPGQYKYFTHMLVYFVFVEENVYLI